MKKYLPSIWIIMIFAVTYLLLQVYHKQADVIQMTQAGVSIQDSITFELKASQALILDLPEETPMTGDSVCAYISNDTVFIQYWNNYPHQQKMFKFIYNQ